jgi:stearoyl-CoA desaturase (delta-9 desaturase)
MTVPPASLHHRRVRATEGANVVEGRVRFAPVKSAWLAGMAGAAVIGGAWTFTLQAFAVFVGVTASVLLLGHSLGSHRKLIHDSYQCPKWLEYFLVWCGVQVGLAGPLGLLRQHELRDYAQRLPACHDYLRHGRSFWRDAWWQLCCELALAAPPRTEIEPRIAQDRFYRFLERTWMAQQLPPALLLYVCGGWAFVFWGTCARVTAGVVGHWLIGHFAHNDGGMHYEVRGAAVQGRNIRFSSLLTMGESWHNNHHAFPGSARLGLFAGEWDPGWWMLLVLRKAGLVWALRLPESLPARPELIACDASAHAGVRRAREAMPAGVLRTWRLCRRARRERLVVATPAASVSAATLQRIVGRRVRCHVDRARLRLVLSVGDDSLRGLPALCVAMGTRGALGQAVGLALAPLAVAFEATRTSLEAA